MRKVLHVGPETCSVVTQILKEDDTEAWGVEPYELDEADANCRSLVSKGVVRVADIKFPLPYKPKSFSLVIVSDALDYLSPKYLNKTVPDLARVASDGLVILSGNSSDTFAPISFNVFFLHAHNLNFFSILTMWNMLFELLQSAKSSVFS